MRAGLKPGMMSTPGEELGEKDTDPMCCAGHEEVLK